MISRSVGFDHGPLIKADSLCLNPSAVSVSLMQFTMVGLYLYDNIDIIKVLKYHPCEILYL